MPNSLGIHGTCALLSAVYAGACGNGPSHDATQVDDPVLLADSCTPAGGECLSKADQPTCSAYLVSQLSCSTELQPEGDRCCLDPLFAACSEGQSFPIKASDYDQSCEKDSDCISIGEGDGCGCGAMCAGAAIHVADQARWNADLEKTPAYAAKLVCNCPAFFGVGCVDHQCALLRPSTGP